MFENLLFNKSHLVIISGREVKEEENVTGRRSRSSRNEGGNQVSIHNPVLEVSLETCMLFLHSVAHTHKKITWHCEWWAAWDKVRSKLSEVWSWASETHVFLSLQTRSGQFWFTTQFPPEIDLAPKEKYRGSWQWYYCWLSDGQRSLRVGKNSHVSHPMPVIIAVTFVGETFGLECKLLTWNLQKCLQTIFEHMCMVSVGNTLE